ncbi:MAG: M20/M25/M40 family metallo-hydrolase [Chloroflexi bacterium]|nr:M20/M25/M40 family metallo-hydrolase [Chloroflexota bacterium]MDA1002426.1 M20/M25/M40 family metallo-hydrolase [Chloroflexota bacterium]
MTQGHAEPTLNWDALTDEAVELLSAYLRVDTVNPPGNESRAADWLADILDREGIPQERYDPGDGRETLVARLPGDGSRGKPLILLNHTDVVPFERSHWTEDPLGGAIKDGFIWGRGAIDMKGMGIMELISFVLHRRHNLPLRRELIFMAVADEEAGSAYGVEFLARAHPELLDCDFVINEGGSGSSETLGKQRPVMSIGVSEKGPLWLTLRARGRPGHGSVPHDDNAADRLVRALQRIQDWERPLMPAPEVREYFAQLHAAGILDAEPTDAVLERIAHEHPRYQSVQSNSISLTQLNAGVKHNVIPAEASATLDIRLVPGYDPDEFLDQITRVIADERVAIEQVFTSSTPPSRLDTELYAVMTQAAKSAIEDVVVVPGVSTGFTDSRVFRRLGVPAYGFVPWLLGPDEQGRAHGNDERVSIENLRLGMQILHTAVRGICS